MSLSPIPNESCASYVEVLAFVQASVKASRSSDRVERDVGYAPQAGMKFDFRELIHRAASVVLII